MNDRFLSKAKRVYNGEWVVGYYVLTRYNDDNTEYTEHCIASELEFDSGVLGGSLTLFTEPIAGLNDPVMFSLTTTLGIAISNACLCLAATCRLAAIWFSMYLVIPASP